MKRWTSGSEEETQRIGAEIAQSLPAEATLFLTGDLGAGKTTLVKAISRALGADEGDVSSPSFSIVNEYPLPEGPSIFHIDGYRLSGVRHEWEEIGIPEILRGPGIKFVEWPREELAPDAGVVTHVTVTVGDDDARVIEMD